MIRLSEKPQAVILAILLILMPFQGALSSTLESDFGHHNVQMMMADPGTEQHQNHNDHSKESNKPMPDCCLPGVEQTDASCSTADCNESQCSNSVTALLALPPDTLTSPFAPTYHRVALATINPHILALYRPPIL